MPYIPSEEEVNARGGDFKPLPEDDYVVSIKEYKLDKQANPYNRTEAFPGGVPRDVLTVKMTVHSFSNGDGLFDVDGDPVAPGREVLLFDFLDTTRTGMKPRPSKWRAFIAAIFNQPIGASISFDSWDDLMDKRFIASAIIKNHPEKGPRNAVIGYKVARKRPARGQKSSETAATPAAPTAAPVASDEDIRKAAEEVFGGDFTSPTDLPF